MVRVTTVPPVGAATFKVTVPVEVVTEPRIVEGAKVNEAGAGTSIDRLAVALTPPEDPVTIAVILFGTTFVVMLNVAVVEPDGTVT